MMTLIAHVFCYCCTRFHAIKYSYLLSIVSAVVEGGEGGEGGRARQAGEEGEGGREREGR